MTDEISKIGFEEFLEDVFGLNIRSAKTLWITFKKPENYFKAAKSADWQQTYTPSLRLWLGLMALMVALQFIWAKPDGSFMQLMKEGMIGGLTAGIESGGKPAKLEGIDFDILFLEMMKTNTLIYPFIFITAMSLLAFVYRAWGESLSYVVRQRFIFAVILPGTVIGLISTILMTFTSGDTYKFISFAQFLFIIGLYFITAYRGPYAHMEGGEKIGRSIFLSFSILSVLLVAQLISFIISMSITLVPTLKAHLGTT